METLEDARQQTVSANDLKADVRIVRSTKARLATILPRPTLNNVITDFLRNHLHLNFVQVGRFNNASFDINRSFIKEGRLKGLIIEPLPKDCSKLQAVDAGSALVEVVHSAVAVEDGEQTIWRFKPEAIEQGVLGTEFAGVSSFKMEALLADEGSIGSRFAAADRSLLRSLVEPVSVKCRTLKSLLAEHAVEQIDLLQIDTAGDDVAILKAFEFARFQPAIVDYRHVHLGPAERREAQQLLAGFGYRTFPSDGHTLAIRAEPPSHIERRAGTRVPGMALDGLGGNVIFCTWTGTNPLTPNRAEALLSIYRETCCPVMFLTPYNMRQWELSECPFHPAYAYLSETHRADYLRVYLMHHFGGGYTDLKQTNRSWMPLFDLLRAIPDAVGLGYREIGPDGVARCGEPLESELRRNYGQLIGNCAYIFRRRSGFTTRWIAETHRVLDSKLEALTAHPACHPMDQSGVILPDGSASKYPLRWAEILGELFHPLVYEFREQLIQADIAPSFQNYR